MQNGKIKVLSDDIICRIAAGEVVERPASVVKELIENSIDAQSTRIEIEIKDGGQKLIEITDNGEGMCRQDAVLAFTPHATSKISDDAELEHVVSLGFRGEALPTIASVARVSMVTRHASEETGSRVSIDGGRILGVDSDSFPCGTRIQVKNLFFNVPARRKFLKSVQADAMLTGKPLVGVNLFEWSLQSLLDQKKTGTVRVVMPTLIDKAFMVEATLPSLSHSRPELIDRSAAGTQPDTYGIRFTAPGVTEVKLDPAALHGILLEKELKTANSLPEILNILPMYIIPSQAERKFKENL